MNDSNLLQTLGQVSSVSAGEVLRDHLRGAVRQMISDVIAEEVTELCGPKHRPAGGGMYRAGTAPGAIKVGAIKGAIKVSGAKLAIWVGNLDSSGVG